MHFENVKDGDVLSSPINLEFGLEGFVLAPFGSPVEGVGTIICLLTGIV